MGLAERDALLSRLLGQEWSHEPLLTTLNLSLELDVLDVGAGEGRLVSFLVSKGHKGQLIGLDPQPGQGVQTGRAEELPFSPLSFDMVFMIRMLTHCPNPAVAVAEAQRVLRPGGRLFIAVHGKEHLQVLMGSLPERGAEDDIHNVLRGAGESVQWLNVKFPVSLTLQDARTLLESYSRSTPLTEADFPLLDTLHLVIFQIQKKGA